MIKAAFFDVDGTLLSYTTRQVRPSAREAIAKLQAKGILCIVATGRHMIQLSKLPVADIPFEMGLLGHSDADVLLHAVSDALLGAAGLGDIGKHFPDTDPQYKGADSLQLLRIVAGKVQEAGYRVSNIDVTMIAQKPKLRPHIDQMQANIAAAVGVDVSRVNVKATTEEHLGFTGTEQGMACHAVCLLEESF